MCKNDEGDAVLWPVNGEGYTIVRKWHIYVGKPLHFAGESEEKRVVVFGYIRQKQKGEINPIVECIQSPLGGYGKLDIFADEETIDFLSLY